MANRRLRRISTRYLLWLPIVLAWGTATQAQTSFAVSWANERLSVRAADALLADVITEVARVTGLKVVGGEKLQARLTTELDNLPVVDALKALLTSVNYLVQEESGAARGRIGLVLHVHSIASEATGAASAADPTTRVIRVTALDSLIADEEEEIEAALEDEADDPDLERENTDNRDAARLMVDQGLFGKATIKGLEEYLRHHNDFIRLEAVNALAERPLPESLRLLIEALGDDAIEVRRAAIGSVGRAQDPASLEVLGLTLEKDADPLVRRGVLRVLALRADTAAIPYVRQAINDDDETNQEIATQMLAELQRMAQAKKKF